MIIKWYYLLNNYLHLSGNLNSLVQTCNYANKRKYIQISVIILELRLEYYEKDKHFSGHEQLKLNASP
jgi:hypothetical protein